MNFGALKDLTAFWLDDLQFGYFTEPQVETWLNNSQKRVQAKLLLAKENYYNECVQTTLVVNQNDYVLPEDFRKLMSLEVVMSGTAPNEVTNPVSPITTNQKFMVPTGSGTPGFYRFKKNRLVVYPAPDTALILRMEYAYMVADMTNATDIPDVPDQYHELLALLACEDGFLKDGRVPDLLAKKIAEFTFETVNDADERNEDQPRGIVVTGADGYNVGGYW